MMLLSIGIHPNRYDKMRLKTKIGTVSILAVLMLILAFILYFEINPFRDQRHFQLWESPYIKELEVGDIVFRTAYGKESRLIQMVSEGEYSHIAVITMVTPEVQVVHATTNDHPILQNQVLLTPINEFLSPDAAKHYLIARPAFLSRNERIQFANMIHSYIGEPYVLKSRDFDNLYCTTLLERPLKTIRPTLEPEYQLLKVPGMNGDYLFPDAFLALPGLELLLKDNEWLDFKRYL